MEAFSIDMGPYLLLVMGTVACVLLLYLIHGVQVGWVSGTSVSGG